MENAGQQRADTRLGSYEIIRRLARGGMAELFLARTVGPQNFEKVVALKKILPKYADRQKYVSLFCDEARLAASLNHANIVQVYDIGLDGGNYFFAMEYLHGQDVRTILHRAWREGEKMPIRFAVQVATQVAAALHYAHNMKRPDGSQVDIVHRDVSPSNIIVTYDGAVKLLDFGVAKAATRTVKTRTGTLKGKISYMSPEQAKGAPVDRRSDIFSLGIVLWEMVTTSRLFRGENDLATLQQIINVPPKKASSARPDCPAELEQILVKALQQDVTQRYQTADELVRDLETFSHAADIGPSATALSVYVSELFTPEINSWNEARAAGVPLAEHLTHIGDMTEPVLESEFIEAMDLPAMLAREEALDDELDVDDDDEEEDEQVTPQVAAVALPRTTTPSSGERRPPPPAAGGARVMTPSAGMHATPPPRPTTPPPIPRRDANPAPAAIARGSLPPSTSPRRPATVPPPKAPVRPALAKTDPTPTGLTEDDIASAPTLMGEAPIIDDEADEASLTDAVGTKPLADTSESTGITERNAIAPRVPPVQGSNPWAISHTPISGSGSGLRGAEPSGVSGVSGRFRAWVSGSFPAQEIAQATAGKWERRGLAIFGAILLVIIVIALVQNC